MISPERLARNARYHALQRCPRAKKEPGFERAVQRVGRASYDSIFHAGTHSFFDKSNKAVERKAQRAFEALWKIERRACPERTER